MDPDPLEKALGIKLLWLIAGFCGGVIALAMDKTLTIGNAFFSVFAGMCCASFLTPVVTILIAKIYVLPVTLEFSVAFLLGLTGLVLARKAYRFVADASIKDYIPGTKKEDNK
jgi:hypothetical protein